MTIPAREALALFPAAALAVALALPAAASAAKPRALPDLRTAAVTAGPHAHPGGPVIVTARVSTAKAAVKRSMVRFYLTADGRPAAGAQPLAGQVSAPALRKGRAATVTAQVMLPADVPVGTFQLVACSDDLRKVPERNERNNCAAARTRTDVSTTQVGADDVIAADLAAKRISEERALVLRVQAVFGDPRLPARYQGDAGAPPDDAVVREAADTWPRLSKAARRTLRPFLLPPAARGSWYDQLIRPQATASVAAAADDDRCDSAQVATDLWASIPAAGGKLRFWYLKDQPGDRKTAEGYVRDIGLTAYPRLKKLFGRDLPSDASTKCYHGPDGATDIYIVERIAGRLLGVTIPSEQTPKNNNICDGTPSFIGVRQGQERWVLTHELVHAFQFSYPYMNDCKDYVFWDESTATWGAQWVWPLDDYEHHGAQFTAMVDITEWASLERHDYDGWIFPLFLERTLGEQTIPATYAQFATTGPITGIDAAIGGFDKVWKGFTKTGWNRETVTPDFMTWDRLADAPHPYTTTPLMLGGAREATVAAEFAVEQLARMYRAYPVTDPKVAEIVFKNTMAGQEGAVLWAELTLADGSQRVEDWTDRKEVRFCRDTPGENVQNVVLMEGNSEWRSERWKLEPDAQPSFALRDRCGDDEPLRYRVLSASVSSTTTGAKSVNQYCGAVSGTTTFEGQAGAAPYDASDAVLPADGKGPKLHGTLGVDVPATFDYVLHGCDDDQARCDTAFSRAMGGNGLRLSIDVEAPSADAAQATLIWSIPDPSIGFVDYDPSVCNVFDFFVGLDPGDAVQTIPMARLRAKGPITLTIQGGPKSWSTDSRGEPATLTYGWRYELTVERVDETGRPLT